MRTPHGLSFERELEGHIFSDNAVGAHKISLFVRLRTLVANGIFWIYGEFLSVLSNLYYQYF
jgi:hypothetical protein